MATGSVPITPGSGALVRTVTNAGVDGGAVQQVFTPADPNGAFFPQDPDGTPQVSPEPTGLFLDDFSGTLTANWTTGGTAPASSGGVLSTNAVTTASNTSYMRSIGTFNLRAGGYLALSFHVKLEAGAVANSTRWWGYGLNQSTPSSTAPVLNGVVFTLDPTAGALQAAYYSAGTKTVVATLTRPTDAALHRYEIVYRQSTVYWLIDSVVVATASFPNLAQGNNLAAIVGNANASTAPSTAPVLQVSSVSVRDTTGTNRTISDGANPWIQATVKVGSTAAAAADQPLVVALHPSSSLPVGSNGIGAIGAINGSAQSVYSAVTTAATIAAAVKTSAGTLSELTITNTSASAIFVKLYNKASAPAPASDVPIAIFQVAANSDRILSWGANGKRFPTGIAIGVTGAVGNTDTTAVSAGSLLHGSYV